MTARQCGRVGFCLRTVWLTGVVVISAGGGAVVADAPPADASDASNVRAVFTADGFPDWVTSVAYSPDGERIAVGSFESVRVFSADDGTTESKWKAGSGFVRALAFSPDGQRLVCGSYKRIEVRDTGGKKIRQLSGHRGYVTDLAFSPAGEIVASASEDSTVRLWDAESVEQVRVLEAHEQPILGIAFSPDGRQLAIAAGDETRLTKPGQVQLWSVETGELIRELPGHERAATDVVFAASGDWLLSSGVDERVQISNVESGEARGFYGGHSRPVNRLLLTAGDRLAISGSGGRFQQKNEIRFWNPEDGETWAVVDEHEGRVTDLALSPDGRRLVSGSYDKTARVWDLSSLLADTSPDLVVVAKDDDDSSQAGAKDTDVIRVGIIGLDTSHAIAFTKLLNAESPGEGLAGCRVVAAYPEGSPDIESSVSRVPRYTEEIQTLGVSIVDSIDELLTQVDAVLLETNDGRPHLEQVIPVLRAGKPVFVDKPIAGSLTEAVAILNAAEQFDVPLFSSSTMRFLEDVQAVRKGEIGDVLGCETYSPCTLEATHPDLFWYGIHGVEALFTAMGTGCESVTRVSTEQFDVVVGRWSDGRIGTFRGLREGRRGFGGTAFGSKAIKTLSREGGYDPLVAAIVQFFKTGKPPVAAAETLEIYAFMEAADESKRRGGTPVELEEVLAKARTQAAQKLKAITTK